MVFKLHAGSRKKYKAKKRISWPVPHMCAHYGKPKGFCSLLKLLSPLSVSPQGDLMNFPKELILNITCSGPC